MKKIIILISVIVLFGLIQNTQATSGGCSWHGGVNCSAGSDWDGSEICNDGWRDSTVNFANSIECNNQASCTNAELNALYIEYQIDEKQNEIAQLDSQINIIYTTLLRNITDVEAKPITMSSINTQKQNLINTANSKIDPLTSQKNTIQTSLNYNLSRVESKCKSLGESRLRQMQIEALTKELEYIQQKKCPINSTLDDDGNCYCNTGYANSILGKGCVMLDELCNELTPNSYHKNGKCYCSEGLSYIDDKCLIPEKPKITEEKITNEAEEEITQMPSVQEEPKVEIIKEEKIKIVETAKPAENIIATEKPEPKTEKYNEILKETKPEVSTTEKIINIVKKDSLETTNVVQKVTLVIKKTFSNITNFFKELKFW